MWRGRGGALGLRGISAYYPILRGMPPGLVLLLDSPVPKEVDRVVKDVAPRLRPSLSCQQLG